MRKKAAIFLLCLLSLFLLSGFDFASQAAGGVYVYDDAGLISENAETWLNSRIASVREERQTDILVVFTNDASVTNARAASEYIASTWISKGYGYGEEHEIISLFVNMADRSYFVNEHNDKENYKLSDSKIDEIKYAVEEVLSTGNYDNAAAEFVNQVDSKTKPGFFTKFYSWILTGLLGGGAAMGIARGSHNVVYGVNTRHFKKGMTNPTATNDIYLETTRVVHKIQQQRPQEHHDSDHNLFTGGGSEGNHGGGGHF